MITYTFTFEETHSGSMKIHVESPPMASASMKEIAIAKHFADHFKKIFKAIEGVIEISEN